jgi:transcriptional regulator with XRE-family HTH domain
MHEALERRKRFRAALAYADITAQEFAARVGVQPGHLSQVLSGKRESAALVQKIDAFIAEWDIPSSPASAVA